MKRILLSLSAVALLLGSVGALAQAARPAAPLAGAMPAAAEGKRVALVVGNSRYAHLSKLENALNDAGDMAKALQRVGFEVIHVQDSRRDALFDAMQRFRKTIQTGGVALFYYAGHGIQSNGVNYLMPVDAAADDEITVRARGVALDEVLGLMNEARAALKIVYLDACREDPPQLKRATRSVARGLAEVPKAQGTIIEFSTSPGNVALDGKQGERNSPYTAALMRNIDKPGLQIEQLGKLVRAEVMSATRGRQEPWTSSSITNDFFFVPPKAGQQQVIVTTIERGGESAGGAGVGSGRGGKKTSDDCYSEGMTKGVDQNDLHEYTQACLQGREFKLVKTMAQCQSEAGRAGVHFMDLVDYINACKYGKPYKVVARKSPQECIREANAKGLKGMDLFEYSNNCAQAAEVKP